ncbi:hypothetical protein VT84_30090 [Gemmata sp. SH-PL17]|uniref:hypothetical protein n=1 Tax=Gemmata sp. SH-PL17 TaxID=1630693 RepID=UPI00078E9B95|nr:hypothetical protein [Gemmata sp. SH-PL17]AMV28694.1 hypothetical protein VT84_30090 [Gemmata sp. SH-PL17]
MRRLLALVGVTSFVFSAPSRADDRPLLQRIAERTPAPLVNIEHSAARAGYPLNVKRHAIPSVTRFDQGGYVGGGSLRNNSLIARGPGSATGPTQDGTYGTDFGGFRAHLGRVFLASSNDLSRGRPAYLAYRTDGPRVLDVFALRPLRKAVLERREDAEEMHHGKEEHGAGGHGAEGHGPEGGEKKGEH